MTESERKVLVEEVLKKLAHPEIGPSAVHEQEPFKKWELGEGKVTRKDRLHTLLTTDTHADVSGCRLERQRQGLPITVTGSVQLNANGSKGDKVIVTYLNPLFSLR